MRIKKRKNRIRRKRESGQSIVAVSARKLGTVFGNTDNDPHVKEQVDKRRKERGKPL